MMMLASSALFFLPLNKTVFWVHVFIFHQIARHLLLLTFHDSALFRYSEVLSTSVVSLLVQKPDMTRRNCPQQTSAVVSQEAWDPTLRKLHKKRHESEKFRGQQFWRSEQLLSKPALFSFKCKNVQENWQILFDI